MSPAIRLGSPATAVIVTGAASGIGRACADALAAVGRPVALWDVAGDEVRDAAEIVAKEFDVPTVGVAVDLADPEQLPRALAETKEAMHPIGALAHCAGVEGRAKLERLDALQWDQVQNINVRAEALLVQILLPDFRAAGPGCAVVGVASIMATFGSGRHASYCTSKAALLGLTHALAVGLAPEGIRVNVVCPGYIRTPMIMPDLEAVPDVLIELQRRVPLARLGEPGEIAAAIRFLLSDEAGFITGAELVVDGGVTRAAP
jgi:NAD(P)-dependent dehydrogenase (short-subunit alcohol dehydrogenase family)